MCSINHINSNSLKAQRLKYFYKESTLSSRVYITNEYIAKLKTQQKSKYNFQFKDLSIKHRSHLNAIRSITHLSNIPN